MKKLWMKKRAVIIYLLLVILFLTTFIGLGYWYSKGNFKYEVTSIGKQVSDLNYTMGSGDVNEITTPMIEGMVTPSLDLINLQAATNDVWGKDADMKADSLMDDSEYLAASKIALMGDSGTGYDQENNEWSYTKADGTVITFEDLNESEKALVILASGPTPKDGLSGVDRAARIIRRFKPVTFIGDDATEDTTASDIKWDPTSDIMYTSMAYGVASAIYTDSEHQTYKVRLKQAGDYSGLQTEGTTSLAPRWDNGDYVTASDVAFGISREMPTMYGSSSAYMLTSISNLQGVSEFRAADGVGQNDEDGNPIPGSAGDLTPGSKYYEERMNTYDGRYGADDQDLAAIYYGLTEDMRTFIEKESDFVPGNNPITDSKVGIKYHDAIKHDGTKIGGADEYSYLQFQLNAPSTTFPTMLNSQAYLPINWEWYTSAVGPSMTFSEFGLNEDSFLSNGAFKITKFDNLYGILYENNPYYYDSDIVSTTKGAYRMMSEAATEVSMFANGQASIVTGEQSTTKILKANEDVAKWIKPKFTSPVTQHMFFNLLPTWSKEVDGDGSSAYIKDPNFRRAIAYSYDNATYNNKAGTSNTQPESLFTPAQMYKDAEGNDLVDYATTVSFTNDAIEELKDGEVTKVDGSKATIDTSDDALLTSGTQQLEYYGISERYASLEDESLTGADLNRSEITSNYYWIKFLSDMDQLGQEFNYTGQSATLGKKVDHLVKLDYLTRTGDKDPMIKTLQEKVIQNENLMFSPKYNGKYGKPSDYVAFSTGHEYYDDVMIDIAINTQATSGVYWEYYYGGTSYDMANLKWLPDYVDAWSSIGVLNAIEPDKSSNSTGAWTFWDGSDYTFKDGEYDVDGKDNDALARELFNDGLSSFYEGTSNVSNVAYDSAALDSYGDNRLVNPADLNLEATLNTLMTDVIEDNTGTATDPATWFASADRVALENGLNHDAHTDDLWASTDTAVSSFILMEIAIIDSGAEMVSATETGSVSPSRMLFEGDPVIGFETKIVGFDITKIKKDNYWSEVEDEIQEVFLK